MTDWDDPVQAQIEPEVMSARRAWAVAQAELAGAPEEGNPLTLQVGWHGTSFYPEAGATGLVDPTGIYADLVGEIVRVSRGRPAGSCYVFVVASARLAPGIDLSLSRRAYSALALLATPPFEGSVQVVA